MTTSPATRPSMTLLDSSTCPIRLADAPNAMKTIEKPVTNATVLIMTARDNGALALLGPQFLEGYARDERQITGHQRQDARRKERNDTGGEGRQQTDITHGVRESITGSETALTGVGPKRDKLSTYLPATNQRLHVTAALVDHGGRA